MNILSSWGLDGEGWNQAACSIDSSHRLLPFLKCQTLEREWLPGGDTLADWLELHDAVLCSVMLRNRGTGCSAIRTSSRQRNRAAKDISKRRTVIGLAGSGRSLT
jgi:hypothetical protein